MSYIRLLAQRASNPLGQARDIVPQPTRLTQFRLPGPGSALASGTPETVAAGQLFGPDPATTYPALLTVAAIDIYLAAMIVDPGWPAHHLWGVLRAYRINSTQPNSFIHQQHQVIPELQELATGQGFPGPKWVDPVAEQHLGSIDIANASQHFLVQQQLTNGPIATPDPVPGRLGVSTWSERIRPQPGQYRLASAFSNQFAHGCCPQVSCSPTIMDPQAHLPDRVSERVEVEPTDQSQVDMHQMPVGELDEEMLSR